MYTKAFFKYHDLNIFLVLFLTNVFHKLFNFKFLLFSYIFIWWYRILLRLNKQGYLSSMICLSNFFYILVFLSSYLIWVIYKIFKYHYMGLIDNVMGVLVSWKIFELIWFSGIYDIFLRLVLQLKKLYKISRHIFHSWNIQLHFSLRELSIDMWFIVIGH